MLALPQVLGSGLMVLRNMSIRLDQLAAEDGDEVLQG
jgi:hypothetical protein